MNLNDAVLLLVSRIPRGKIATYRQLARALNTKAYRAVGRALHNNKTPIVIPCHRIVKSDGALGGYNGGAEMKIRLLASEGIKVENGRIVNFSEHLVPDSYFLSEPKA